MILRRVSCVYGRLFGFEIMYEGEATDWEQFRSFYIKDSLGYEIDLSEHFGGALN